VSIAAVPQVAHAQFYKGRTITFIVNYPVGSPTDLEGRIVALHLPNHIPGNPNVVVKNVWWSWRDHRQQSVGRSQARRQHDGILPAMKTKYSDFVLVSGVESPLVVYMRGDTSPGVKVPEDLMKTQEFRALSLNLQNSARLVTASASPRWLSDTAGRNGSET
jgi:hypothetical protein